MQVMPRLGLEEQELHAIVESACKEPPKGLSKPMREVLESLGVSPNAQASAVTSESIISQKLWEWGTQIEALSEDYPLLKDICKGLKRNQYPAAMFVAGGLMMTLMTRCT